VSEQKTRDPSLSLFQRLANVQREVGYVKKDVVVSGAKGVARDAVVAAVRQALIDNGVFVYTTQKYGRFVPTEQKSSSGTPLTIYVGTYATHFVNIDAPSDAIARLDEFVVEHEAQGNDYGDKAPGKAATYAEKLNLVKGLLLETGINDEGRNPGEGDESTPDGAQDEKPSGIKAPQRKSAEKNNPDALPPTKLASAGLIKQVVDLTEATGQGERLAAYLKKVGRQAAELTDAQAKAVLRALSPPEPGSEG